MVAPRNLDELRSITDPAERARAAGEYVAARVEAISTARMIRDEALRELRKAHSISATARLAGVSTTLVKVATR